MNLRQRTCITLIALYLFNAPISAQDSLPVEPAIPLFADSTTLALKITTNRAALMGDRGENPQFHPGKMEFMGNDGQLVSLPVSLRSRGHFRKNKLVCNFAPLLLQLEHDSSKKTTVFARQHRLKLVMPCQKDELVEREYLLYKIYNMLTPLSLRARRVQLLLADSANPQKRDRANAFLLEPPEQAEKRNGLLEVKKTGVNPESLMPSDFNLMAVFQFFIGNTDWSVQYLHNIELAAKSENATAIPIAYDFDHAGLVNAPYALPAPELDLESVQERRYRGFCIQSMQELQRVFDLFNQKKPEIISLYSNNPALSASYRKWAIDYINKFYSIINDPKKAEAAFTYPCRPGGTGSIIIRGLHN